MAEHQAAAANLRAARVYHRRSRVNADGSPAMRINGEEG
jgi:hypothetical protein